MTRNYRYPWSAIRGDYIRAAIGGLLCGVPLLAAPGTVVSASILGALAALFAAFAVRTVFRHSARYEVGEDAITATGLSTFGARRASVRWAEMDRVRLAFYSTRRDRSHGWMHLTVRGGGRRLGIDSVVAGFDDIARRAAGAAAANRVPVNDSTVRNFQALGLTIDLEDGRAVSAYKGGIR